jgi:hypothetical protein
MKKVIIAITSILLVAVLVFKVANAQTSVQDVKKETTEKKMDCCKNSSAAKACEMKTCDKTKCKEGKCDTAKCKSACAEMKSEMKNCDHAKCPGMVKK